VNKFTLKSSKINLSLTSGKPKNKTAEIIKLSPSIPTHLSKEVLEKSKFFSKGKKLYNKG